MTSDPHRTRKLEGEQTPQNEGKEQPPFIEPKLTFIEPKLEKHGSVEELTTAVVSGYVP